MEFVFWISLFIIFYSYIGYGGVLYLMIRIFRTDQNIETPVTTNELPSVTLMIAAYNEQDCILDKIHNTRRIDYPADRLNVIFVTDGSTDGTPDIIRQNSNFHVFHKNERRGKINAINRMMKYINTPITVFSDANTMFNRQSIREIVKHYQDPKVGAVSGEKRVTTQGENSVSGAGEGLYWKYESFLKKLDSRFYSIVGAAGEIFSIRTGLYREIEKDTILDDFIISLRIAAQGFRVVYEPAAYALETPSASITEEMKRKVRIAAGGFQAILRLKHLLNPVKYGVLTFQYVSHRVLRWAFDPFALIGLFVLNYFIMNNNSAIYTVLFYFQVAFYLFALFGWLLESKHIRTKILYVPFYFTMMNFAALVGFYRFLKGEQSVRWKSAKRV